MASIGHWPARDGGKSTQAIIIREPDLLASCPNPSSPRFQLPSKHTSSPITTHHTALNMVLSKQHLFSIGTYWMHQILYILGFCVIVNEVQPQKLTTILNKFHELQRHELFWRGKILNAYDMNFFGEEKF
jgi:hypothetical protein